MGPTVSLTLTLVNAWGRDGTIKVRASTGDPTLLDGFPLYWTTEPKLQSVQRLKDLSPKD